MAQSTRRRRKCLYCRGWFTPDHRKGGQQRYCSDERCRKASKATSQRRWLRKAENVSYFQGREHVDRVQHWRRAHPQYWRRKATPDGVALQDLIDTQAIEGTRKSGYVTQALQDLMARFPKWRLQGHAGDTLS